MAYIYKITNDVNGKIYVGKTRQSIHKRWLQHQYEARSDRVKHRPLYQAIQKYGIEHFHIETIEETDNPEEREIYWIEKLGSFKNGYNATFGGDGKPFIDRDLVVATYNQLQNCVKVADKLGIHRDSVYTILAERNVHPLTSHETLARSYSKCINQYSKNNEYIASFPSGMEAARQIILAGISKDTVDGVRSHISQVCNGKRKSAYGFIWKFSE